MYVDPEILAGLDETQKQTLFCKMREEQIRRWSVWEQTIGEKKIPLSPKQNTKSLVKRNVDFLKGEDNEPWVWVMGEHAQDKTIEDILAEEAQAKAHQQAMIETIELRKSVEAELSDIIEYENDRNCDSEPTKGKLSVSDDEEMMSTPKIEEMEIYCSVDELRERMNQIKLPPPTINTNSNNNINNSTLQSSVNKRNYQNLYGNRLTNFNFANNPDDKKNVLQEISLNKPTQRVSARIAQWETRVIGERTNEIYKRMQKKQQECAKEAEEAAKKHEEFWKEQG